MSETNPARPNAGIALCSVTELADPGSRGFEFTDGEHSFAGFVVRIGDQVAGFVDVCPHAGWRLAPRGNFLNRTKDRILCTGHRAEFDFNGLGSAGKCIGLRLEPWPIKVVDGTLMTA